MLPEGLGHRGCGRSAEGHPPVGVTTGRGCGDQDSVRGRRAADGAATRSGAPRDGGGRSRGPDAGGLGLPNGARSDTAPSLRHETAPNHRLQGAVALNESKMPAPEWERAGHSRRPRTWRSHVQFARTEVFLLQPFTENARQLPFEKITREDTVTIWGREKPS